MHRHRLSWTALRRRFKGPNGWRSIVLDGVELFNISSVTVTRYRWRGTKIPSPLADRDHRTSGMNPLESRMR